MEPDTEPISRATSADEAGFRAFFDAEYARLVRVLALVTGDRGEAEDIAQEAFVRVFERWNRIRVMDSPVGYLHRTGLNISRSRFRRLVRRIGHRHGEVPPAPDPAGIVEDRDEASRALENLSRAQREALVLVEWLGLTYEDAGRVLGIEPVSVRARVSRARGSILRTLEENHE